MKNKKFSKSPNILYVIALVTFSSISYLAHSLYSKIKEY